MKLTADKKFDSSLWHLILSFCGYYSSISSVIMSFSVIASTLLSFHPIICVMVSFRVFLVLQCSISSGNHHFMVSWLCYIGLCF